MLTFPKMTIIALVFIGMIFLACALKNKTGYPALTQGGIVLQGDPGRWDENSVHTLSVVRADREGYKYWGYYGLDYYNGPAEKRKAGLARSNDLVRWEKYLGNPIVESNCRWPFVILADGVFHMFYEEYNLDMESRIVKISSRDGIQFSRLEEVVPYEKDLQNQNPFVYLEPRDKSYCLFYYHGMERGPGRHEWNIRMKRAVDPSLFNQAPYKTILSSVDIIASPSLAYYDRRYFLTVESFRPGQFDNKWTTRAYESRILDGNFIETKNSPILRDNDACAFQTVFEGELIVFYSQRFGAEKNYWDLRMGKGK
jgi:hypothetical protein